MERLCYGHRTFRKTQDQGEMNMAYTALEKMRRINSEKTGVDIGPKQPYLYGEASKDKNELKAAAAEFIHNSCEKLRFDEKIEEAEAAGGKYQGVSVKKGQIPYNMQMDIDRLCLERALERFTDSGTAEDAFDVYFCYIEMFFGTYENKACRRMVEKLSEFESNGSSLIMKHRDHYSHSVYVFELGLAIYQKNAAYRNKYKSFCGFEDDKTAAHHFLQYWGLASLFHDIGYPFELPFEQVKSYFSEAGENNNELGAIPFIAFKNIEKYTGLDTKTAQKLKELYGRDFADSNELFAYCIAEKLGKAYNKTEDDIRDILSTKPSLPNKFGFYMDHAYFSATVLLKTLCNDKMLAADKLTRHHIDAMTAIILHNSLYKFSVKSKEHDQPFKAEYHPLAYMLMLCDELQCWDRTSYGRNSRSELHAMDCTFEFSGDTVTATYWYDEYEYNNKMSELTDPEEKRKLELSSKQEKIYKDASVAELSEIKLKVSAKTRAADYSSKNLHISQSNFIHLYNFAVALNARYTYQDKEKDIKDDVLEDEFNALSLEYKLSNIGQAKAFSKHLDAIGCFYTDRPVDYPMLIKFTEKDIDVIGPLEHERWLREHIAMGWVYSTMHTEEKYKSDSKAIREQTRGHHDMVILEDGEELTPETAREHYHQLNADEQDKDVKPMNSMLELIKKYDGLRIYRYK